jgi:hypothetical protein
MAAGTSSTASKAATCYKTARTGIAAPIAVAIVAAIVRVAVIAAIRIAAIVRVAVIAEAKPEADVRIRIRRVIVRIRRVVIGRCVWISVSVGVCVWIDWTHAEPERYDSGSSWRGSK